jgi:coniferyl-aldehyde dehydrogenase
VELGPTLERLRTAWRANKPSLEQRRADLGRLRHVFARRLDAMDAAIRADFGHRSPHENLISEAMVTLSEIDLARRKLRRWAKPRRVGVGWKFWPASAELRPVPVGVVGIISPWNYPVNLALVPLVSAIAAGNHVYLKPSEHTPRTSEFLRELLAEVFPADRVSVAVGGADVGAAFSALPFDHLLFTGSTAVGRKVMAAAAPNLTPVTLELGGKAPAVVAPDFPLDLPRAHRERQVVQRGADVHRRGLRVGDAARRDAFVDACAHAGDGAFGDLSDASNYTRIINTAQFDRLQGLLADARARGATVLPLIDIAPERMQAERLLPPTVVLDAPDDSDLMRHEIFGPILPVKTYARLDDALSYIGTHDRPLALYPFSNERATVERIVDATLAGGVTGERHAGAFRGRYAAFRRHRPKRHGCDPRQDRLRCLQQAAARVFGSRAWRRPICCGRRTPDSSIGWCASSRAKPVRADCTQFR